MVVVINYAIHFIFTELGSFVFITFFIFTFTLICLKILNMAYEDVRTRCINEYRKLYKDSLVFDICKIDKPTRLRLQQDPVYIAETKAAKASLFVEQLDLLDTVLAGQYFGEKSGDTSSTILKALEMKNKLLLEDLNVNKDDSNALNITYTAMTKEDFENSGTVEIIEGSSTATLGASFGASDDNDSFEARMKAEVQKKLKEKEKRERN